MLDEQRKHPDNLKRKAKVDRNVEQADQISNFAKKEEYY